MKQNANFHFHPSQLRKFERAKHVVAAILAYNKGIIKNNPLGAKAKFERLATSPFVFMRGTADLMYQDFYKTDADKALVLCMGDVHLENFGVMEAEKGQLIWGLNDFDEATFAPFTWDVKRGVVSVIVAARENNFKTKQQFKLAKSFAKAYLDQIKEGYFIHEKEYLQTSVIQNLLESVQQVNPEKWLKEKYLDVHSPIPQFKMTSEIVPLPRKVFKKRKVIIKKAMDDYLTSLDHFNNKKPDAIKVLDIATKAGSGTASIGLWRYYALVEMQIEKGKELMILEIKQERPSVLAPYIGELPVVFETEGARVAFAEHKHLPNANPYYGYTTIAKNPYLVRKRSPFKSRVNIIELDNIADFEAYIQACGSALADAHLRANIPLRRQKSVSKRILKSIKTDDFDLEMAYFAMNMAKQVRRDYKAWKNGRG